MESGVTEEVAIRICHESKETLWPFIFSYHPCNPGSLHICQTHVQVICRGSLGKVDAEIQSKLGKDGADSNSGGGVETEKRKTKNNYKKKIIR